MILDWIPLKYFNFQPAPLWFISKAVGMVPYVSKGLDYKLSPTGVVYSVFCCILYVISYCYTAKPSVKYPAICLIGNLIHEQLGFCLCASGFVLVTAKGQLFSTFKRQLGFIDETLFSIRRIQYNFYGHSNRFQAELIVVAIVLFASVSACDTLIFQATFRDSVIATSVAYVFPYFTAIVVQSQFIAFIYSIYMRFIEINRSLNHIATVNEITSKAVIMYKEMDNPSTPHLRNRNPPTPVLFMIGDGSKSPEKFSPKKNKPSLPSNGGESLRSTTATTHPATPVSSVPEMPSNLHLNLDTLFSLHDQLLDLSETVNDMYALQIVAFITVSFVIILFGFFFETKVIFWLWGDPSPLVLIATSHMLWCVTTALVVYTILTICTKTREEAYESALIVHKILQNKPVFMLNDEIYYNKMKSFTLQILHRKNTFNFNGMGLFPLDYTFIFSAVSAATSYLIVLLQFDLSADLK